MSNNISRRSFIGGSGLLALALAGCGGNSGGGSSEEFSFDGTVFSIATDTIFAPFEYTEADGTYVGIDIDILAAVAADQGFEYELEPLGFNAALQAVQSGQADGMIAGMSITEERKETFDFSDPYYDSTVCAATKADNPAATLYDLDGQTVAVKTGTQSEKWANSVAAQYGFTTVQFDDSDIMYQDVLAGNTAACFEDTPIMTYAIATGNVDLKIIAQVDSTSEFATPYGFAVKKGENAELLAAFNAGLATIKGDGTYQEIIDKYMTTE
ncbi:MAG: transporter substrate-binding domain-containing protein [Atopobiaceae bacterium]|nr:transporter substrate-binding domain-containing protein [Atopobiaceae bacterium]